MMHGAVHTISSRHVEAGDTDVGGAPAGRHFFTRQHFNKLFRTASRIERRHRNHFNGKSRIHTGGLHRCDGFGFIVFDANNDMFRAQHEAHHLYALHDLRGAFAHQHIVASNPGFAFGAV